MECKRSVFTFHSYHTIARFHAWIASAIQIETNDRTHKGNGALDFLLRAVTSTVAITLTLSMSVYHLSRSSP